MLKDNQTSKSVLDEGADKTLHLNIPIPNPDTAQPADVVHYRILVGQAWIEKDIESGFLPASVSSFSELGNYSDHNMYLIDEDLDESKVGSFYQWDWDVQKVCDHFNAVAEALNAWLASGRKGNAADYIDIGASLS